LVIGIDIAPKSKTLPVYFGEKRKICILWKKCPITFLPPDGDREEAGGGGPMPSLPVLKKSRSDGPDHAEKGKGERRHSRRLGGDGLKGAKEEQATVNVREHSFWEGKPIKRSMDAFGAICRMGCSRFRTDGKDVAGIVNMLKTV
jgi:hypothetical protein